MIKKYSIGKIFQNEFRMHYNCSAIIGNIILMIFVTLPVFTTKYKERYLLLYIDLIIISIAVLIMIKSILKIRKYFKYGLLVCGEIIKREEIVEGFRRSIRTFTVIANYYIDDQIYQSSNTFIDRKDISYLKEGTKLMFLVSQKNKNDAIIVDLYAEEKDT